jgi:antirestriction protein
MKQDINISEASVYVGTYGKYNSGSIKGKWLDLYQFTDAADFYEACAALHSDEEDPEYMFQDWENIPEGLISEHSISANFFEVRDALQDMEDNQAEAFLIWCNNNHSSLSSEPIDDLISSFNDEYIGAYGSEEDFAYEEAENQDLTEFAKTYFDYEKYANDLFCGDYWFSDGHVFRS